MDIAKINSLFAQARHEQRQHPAYDVRPTQHEIRTLVAGEPDSDDKTWALRLADNLASPLPPAREWSALYDEAAAIAGELPAADAPIEQQVAALSEARRRIWEIADRAAPDEEVHIRALASPLERIQDYLQPPTFGSGD
ncbi:hypothetical protein ACFVWG_28280 [Kribbella sp. NPDC058245]|uniref:hypothetical protein n=1 Tax=Kribbella sp. NPDC058245 TaxID=3346399 RepID=UPI0036E19C5D